MRIRHVAACPEDNPIACAADPTLPDYRHDQRITWLRASPWVHVGLGKGWQVSASVPVDVRVLRVRYTDLDGAPYAPPYAEIHHRNETLAGPVDGRVLVRKFARTDDGLVLGGGVGVTVPLGRTEEDPYALTARGLEHQHQQLGSGTVDPVLTALLWKSWDKWGVQAQGEARLGVMTNGKGYRPPTMASLLVGPTWRLAPAWMIAAGAELQGETPERWTEAPYGGRVGVVADGAIVWARGPWTVQLDVRGTVWQHDHGGGDESIRANGVVTTGVTWTPPPRE